MIQSRRVAGNVMATVITQLISWVLTFVVMLYLPRYVGDAGLGKLTFAAAFISIFSVFVSLGTAVVLVRGVAQDRSRMGELLSAVLLLRIPLGIIMAALASAAVWALGYPAITRELVMVTAIGMIINNVNSAFSSTLQGLENMPLQSVAIIVEKCLSSGLTIALIIHKSPLWMLAAVGVCTGMVSILVNLAACRSLLSSLRWPDGQVVHHIIRAGLPFMGWTVFQTLYGQTDPVVLKLITNDATVGWYSAAFRLVGTTLFFPSAVSSALLPTLSRLYSENLAEYQHLARRSLALVMLFGVPISLVLLCAPDRLIALMHYPSSFSHSIVVLRIGGIGVLLWSAANVIGSSAIASNRQEKMFRASIIATVIGIPACFLGTYVSQKLWHNGAIGAIASDVLLETFLITVYLRILPGGTFGYPSVQLMGRYLLAAIPMAVLLILAAGSHLGLWVVVPCAAVYTWMCWVLRCLDPQYLVMAKSMFNRKLKA